MQAAAVRPSGFPSPLGHGASMRRPAFAMLSEKRDRFRAGIDTVRHLHVLRARQIESGPQHLGARPFDQAFPHRPGKDERRVVKLAHLNELSDHHRFEHGLDSSGRHDIRIGHEYELVQPREKRLMFEDLLHEGVRLLLEGQADTDADALAPRFA